MLKARLSALRRSLFGRAALEKDLDDELAGYLAALEERHRARGLGPEAARREALLELGGLEQVKEDVRAVRPSRALESWAADLRHAARALARMPGLAAVVVVSLAAGIGANTAVFSWIQAIVLKPLPGVRDAALLHLLEARAETGSYPGSSWPEYRDLREQVPSLPDLIAFRTSPLALGEDGATERVLGMFVSANYFSALGLSPAAGAFPEATDEDSAEPAVIVSHHFWQERLGGDPGVVGRVLRINGRHLTAVAVAPRGFQGTVLGLAYDLWVPAGLAPALLGGPRELEDRAQRGYSLMGRLAPGRTRTHAQAEVDAAMRDLAHLHPRTNATVKAEVLPFWQAPRGPQRFMARGLAVLQAVMLLLLLAVCANTANLVLARTASRRREIGVRLALGAAPWRVVRLLLTESLLLATAGAALGAVVAAWGTKAIRDVPITGAFPIRFQTRVDEAGLAVAVLLGLGCAVLFGLAPALQLARTDPRAALASGPRTAPRSRLQGLLMAAEAGLAVVVLVVAALFLKSFAETREADTGFRRDGVLLAAYDLQDRGAGDSASRAFAARLLERARALPGVEDAAIARMVPLDIHGLPVREFTLEGRARPDGRPDQALWNLVTPGYFDTMGIPLVSGRDFAALDEASLPAQAVVNEEFVKRFVETGSALGRRLQSRGASYTITAVVRNSAYNTFGEATAPIIYFSYRDRPSRGGEIHLRTRPGAEARLAAPLQAAAREIDPTLPLHDVRSLSEHIDKNLVFRKIPARIFAVMGPLLLLVAAIGIYAVVSFAVARRTVEIGIRLALGATSRRVVAEIVGETLRAVGAGALAGWLVAALVALHVARTAGAATAILAVVPALLLVVAACAGWLPARRAARVSPVVALRQE